MGKTNGIGSVVQKVVIGPAETVAGTLAFDKVETGMSIYDKVGWIIHRIEYRISMATLALFNGTGDHLTFALVSTNTLTVLADSNPAIYALRDIGRLDFGTAANARIDSNTLVDDYSGLPGGGLLVLPNPLYGAVVGTGLTAAAGGNMIVYCTPMELNPDDYTNLVQARQLLINS